MTFVIMIFSYFSNVTWLEKKRKKELFSKKRKRQVQSQYKGMSLEQYIKYETTEKSEIATLLYSIPDNEDYAMKSFHFKIDYFWNCVDDLSEKGIEILDLWNEIYTILDQYETIEALSIYLSTLASLTYEAGISFEKRSQLDNELTDLMYKKLNNNFKDGSFKVAILEVVKWFTYKANYYYAELRMGYAERELAYLEELYEVYEREFELLKSESPRSFMRYSNTVWHYYLNIPKRRDKNYDKFVNYILLSSVSVCRNTGDFDTMSEVIYLYNKGILKRSKGIKKLWWYLLDISCGFGEAPTRLLYIFLGTQFIFLVLNYPYKFSLLEFNGLVNTPDMGVNIVSTFYFNSTTMLTSVYGDISPSNSITRIVVVIEQTLGFVLTGSFIALFLRKVFRY